MHDQFVEGSKKHAHLVYPGTEDFLPRIIEFLNRLEQSHGIDSF